MVSDGLKRPQIAANSLKWPQMALYSFKWPQCWPLMISVASNILIYLSDLEWPQWPRMASISFTLSWILGQKTSFWELCVSLAKKQFVFAPLIHSPIPIEFECAWLHACRLKCQSRICLTERDVLFCLMLGCSFTLIRYISAEGLKTIRNVSFWFRAKNWLYVQLPIWIFALK